MGRLGRIFLLVCFLLGPVYSTLANHIFGGELLYTHIAANQYKITLTLYGDCNSDGVLFNQLYVARPVIAVYDTTSLFTDSFTLKLEPGSGNEVSPVCPSQINQTYCSGGTLPGVKQFIYSDTIYLSHQSRLWQFLFTGSLGSSGAGSSYSAGRSSHITNLTVVSSLMYLQATLNNLHAPNSSPVYSTIPTPFYCVNVLQQYNNGAVDADGDSLSFSLVPAINYNPPSVAPVSYLYPYTATMPMGTTAGGFVFNTFNGQITFTPNIIQDALIVNQVNEYRNGVLVGMSEREMTFVVQDNCNGVPPVASISSLSGGVLAAGNVINICVGEPSVSFNVSLNNASGDIVDITSYNVPASAALTISGNHTPNPAANFSWATGALVEGHYTFYLNIKSNHCPLTNTQTVAYTINVAKVPVISAQQVVPTDCIHQALIQYTLTGGFDPRSIIIMQGSSVVKTISNNSVGDTVIVRDSLPPGTYQVILKSDQLCVDTVNFTIVDSGTLQIAPLNKSYCLGDPSLPIVVVPVVAGAAVSWYMADSVAMLSAPVVNTFSEGVTNWYFIEHYDVCSSGPVPVTATVHGRPNAEILNIPQTVCFGDAIYLKGSGGVEYTWAPESAIKHDTTGFYVEVLQPITIVLVVKDEFGCIDTTNVTYSDIQQCCHFAYPNAFTPNNDGHNDGFKVVTYGNMRHYSLTIFNRWGQRVFFTADPLKPWDGTFGGEPCEVGTYYYYMDAECLTGPKEQHKGDVVLIR